MTGIYNISNNQIYTNNVKGSNSVRSIIPFAKKDEVELSTKDKSTENKPERSTAHKVGTAAASLLIPGLGQLINGETSKAALMFLGAVAARIFLPFGDFIVLGVRLYSAYDSYTH